MSIEAMKQALDVLIEINKLSIGEDAVVALPGEIDGAMDSLRAAIEQAEKPVAWMYDFLADNRDEVIRDWVTQSQEDIARENGFNVRPLYAAPRQEYYDQTTLELCKECGWRAMIPGDGCLLCARQKAKPVAYADSRIHGWPDCFVMEPDPPHTVPLYTEPREWVGLTDEEISDLWCKISNTDFVTADTHVFARDIEEKLKEKNAA
jgi:hypothetical protein